MLVLPRNSYVYGLQLIAGFLFGKVHKVIF